MDFGVKINNFDYFCGMRISMVNALEEDKDLTKFKYITSSSRVDHDIKLSDDNIDFTKVDQTEFSDFAYRQEFGHFGGGFHVFLKGNQQKKDVKAKL